MINLAEITGWLDFFCIEGFVDMCSSSRLSDVVSILVLVPVISIILLSLSCPLLLLPFTHTRKSKIIAFSFTNHTKLVHLLVMSDSSPSMDLVASFSHLPLSHHRIPVPHADTHIYSFGLHSSCGSEKYRRTGDIFSGDQSLVLPAQCNLSERSGVL